MSTELDKSTTSLIEEDVVLDTPYNLFLWNDPVTPMQVVTYVLKQLFGFSKEKAEELMLQAHNNGKVVIFTGSQQEAERYCVQLHAKGLMASVAKDA